MSSNGQMGKSAQNQIVVNDLGVINKASGVIYNFCTVTIYQIRQKTPEMNYKKGPRALLDGQSITSKLGDHSLERKTFDGTSNG